MQYPWWTKVTWTRHNGKVHPSSTAARHVTAHQVNPSTFPCASFDSVLWRWWMNDKREDNCGQGLALLYGFSAARNLNGSRGRKDVVDAYTRGSRGSDNTRNESKNVFNLVASLALLVVNGTPSWHHDAVYLLDWTIAIARALERYRELQLHMQRRAPKWNCQQQQQALWGFARLRRVRLPEGLYAGPYTQGPVRRRRLVHRQI